MNVLIGFEESQTVCKEFRKIGHNAFSCDLKDCSGGHPEWHLKMDIFEAIQLMHWDFIGLHPVCSKMTLAGNRHYAEGKPKHLERMAAVEWTINVWRTACKTAHKVYMENPMGAMNGDERLPKPQIIHPYYFGDSASKTTCLWLQNLKPLVHIAVPDLFNDNATHVEKEKFVTLSSGKRMGEWYYETSLLTHDERAQARSVTFPGIAKAMAQQWGVTHT
jgi:hypothetical protein